MLCDHLVVSSGGAFERRRVLSRADVPKRNGRIPLQPTRVVARHVQAVVGRDE
jgi:hypothetical protein